MSDISRYDQVEHFWCPMLGQTITFGYCRRMAEGLPCHRIIVCYSSHFAVADFLAQHYTPAQQEQFLAPPKSRLERVMEALEKVRERQDEGES